MRARSPRLPLTGLPLAGGKPPGCTAAPPLAGRTTHTAAVAPPERAVPNSTLALAARLSATRLQADALARALTALRCPLERAPAAQGGKCAQSVLKQRHRGHARFDAVRRQSERQPLWNWCMHRNTTRTPLCVSSSRQIEHDWSGTRPICIENGVNCRVGLGYRAGSSREGPGYVGCC